MVRTSQHPTLLNDILATLATASGIGYLATAFTISRWLTRATPGQPQRPLADHGMHWENLECRTTDGFCLAGWLAEPSRSRATVVLFHGLRANRAETLERIFFLTAAGYRCVAFDHRAHGQSEGKRSSFGYFEGRDAAAVLDLVAERWPSQPRAALGISMGAAALCFASPKTRLLQAVILESLYHDLASAFETRVGKNYPAWFFRFRRGVAWITEKRLGIPIDLVAPSREIDKIAPAPVLLMTGSEDPHAPVTDLERLYHRCQGPRDLEIIPGAGHEDVCAHGGEFYKKRILGFLDRYIC